MRSLLFNIYFYSLTILCALLGAPLTLLKSNQPLRRWVHLWARAVRWGMARIGGITVEFRGLENVPKGEPVLLAAKHQSIIDGVLLLSEMPDLATVAMAELSKRPVIGRICHKLEMIMVDRFGGRGAHHLARGAARALDKGRPIVIYPEGEIRRVGERGTYKKGIWHLQKTSGLPVIPVATNVGLRWEQNRWKKNKGHAVVEFLAPIAHKAPGHAARTFLADLENKIESATLALLKEGRGTARPGHPRRSAAVNSIPVPAIALTPQV